MEADFSALDAELDGLGAEPASDISAIVGTYAKDLGDRLADIDAALNALAADVDELGVPERMKAISSNPPPASSMPPPPASEEIVLPEPVLREDPIDDASGELSLGDDDTPRSGAYALTPDTTPPSPGAPFTEDLTFDAEVEELIELTPVPATAVVGTQANALFDLSAPANVDAERDPDADFDALFGEIPVTEPGYDDTEIFDSGSLAFEDAQPKLEPIENAFTAEELDSAEFEIVMESSDTRPHAGAESSLPPPGSQPPEKRPSFLGRLFGRKDE